MAQRTMAARVRFSASPSAIDGTTVLRLPAGASNKLPSRGQVAARVSINGHEFDTVVEPDGNFGHWLKVDEKLRRVSGLRSGDQAAVEVEPIKDWPEPSVPPDLHAALAAAPLKIRYLWEDITPMARWEWVRWLNATANSDTRKKRVEVSISKMNSGKRRPCCFNLASCTDPELAKNGRLREL